MILSNCYECTKSSEMNKQNTDKDRYREELKVDRLCASPISTHHHANIIQYMWKARVISTYSVLTLTVSLRLGFCSQNMWRSEIFSKVWLVLCHVSPVCLCDWKHISLLHIINTLLIDSTLQSQLKHCLYMTCTIDFSFPPVRQTELLAKMRQAVSQLEM